MRVRRKPSQSVWRPARHRSQVMHGTWWCTNTRAPTANGAPGPACDHLARRLVAQHQGRPRVLVPGHQVAPAQAARAHAHDQLARPGDRVRALLDA